MKWWAYLCYLLWGFAVLAQQDYVQMQVGSVGQVSRVPIGHCVAAGFALQWNATTNQWICQAIGSGAGASVSAPYVTYALDSQLSAERVLTAGTYTSIDTVTASQVKIQIANLPSCTGSTNALQWNGTAFLCTTISGGGGGGGNFLEQEVNFGATPTTNISVAVTGATWVTATTKILCNATMLATSDRGEGQDDAVVEELTCSPHTRVVGTGFTLACHAPQDTTGRYKIHCTGG